MPRLQRSGEQPRIPPHHHLPDRPFAPVIIQRQRAVIHKFLQAASWLTDKGRHPTGDAVRRAVDELAAQGRLAAHPSRSGYWAVPPELHTAAWLSGLARDTPERLAQLNQTESA